MVRCTSPDNGLTMLVICEANVQKHDSWVDREINFFPVAGDDLASCRWQGSLQVCCCCCQS